MLDCKNSIYIFIYILKNQSLFFNKGMHIFYVTSVIVCITFLIFFTLVFSYLYFDGIYNQNKINSKKNNKGITILKIYEGILVICFNFMEGDSFNPLLIYIYLLGSYFTLYYLHI